MARTTPLNAGYTIVAGSGTGTNGSRIDVWVEYAVLSQDIAANLSRVSAKFYAALRAGQSSSTKYASGLNAVFTVGGQAGSAVANGAYDFTSSANLHTLGTFEGDIAHNAEGTATLTIEGSFTTRSSYISGGRVSAAVSLPAIPRSSSLTCPPSAMVGEVLNIGLRPVDAACSHRLTLQLADTTLSAEAAAGQESIALPLPLSLAQAMPNAASAAARVVLATYLGQTLLGQVSKSLTLTLPESLLPTAGQLTFTHLTEAVPAEWGIYVQGKSRVAVSLQGAAGIYGSSITGYSLQGAGVSAQAPTLEAALLESGQVAFRATVKDSRGRTSLGAEGSIEVQPYEPPALSGIRAFRCDAGGAVQAEGTYLHLYFSQNFSPLAGHNTAQVSLSYRATGQAQAVNHPTPLAADTVHILPGFGADTAYTLSLSIQDALSATAYPLTLPTAERVLNVAASGKGLAIGQMCDQEGFTVAWPACFRQEISAAGGITVAGKTIADIIYPVGSVYLTFGQEDPATLFGGSWQQVQNAFLYGCGPEDSPGTRGGAAQVSLGVRHLPEQSIVFTSRDAGGWSTGRWQNDQQNTYAAAVPLNQQTQLAYGQPLTILPPYVQVHIWHRVA